MDLELRELTPAGRGAIAVLELRGRDALAEAQRLVPRARLAPGRLTVALLEYAGRALDQALVVVHAEDRVELHLHGSPVLVAEVRAALEGARRPAPPQTIEELALARLAGAPCEAAARILLDQAEGALRGELEGLLALGQPERSAAIDELLARAAQARFALQPARVLLCGPANAGKSTLFNALHGAERVLVSAAAGTTRDVIVERIRLGAWPFDLWDSPGHIDVGRQPSRALELERAGLEHAAVLAADADVLLWVSAAGQPGPPPELEEQPRLLALESCADRLAPAERQSRPDAVSALHDPGGAVDVVARLLRGHLGLPEEPWRAGSAVPFDEVQRVCLERAREASRGACREHLGELLAARVAGRASVR